MLKLIISKLVNLFKAKPYSPFSKSPSLMNRLVWYAGGSLKRLNDAILLTKLNTDGTVPLEPLLNKIYELLKEDGKYQVLQRNKEFREKIEKDAEKRLT
jgi:hypothetical protein